MRQDAQPLVGERCAKLDGALAFVRNLAGGDVQAPDPAKLVALLFLAPIVVLHGWTWLVEHGYVRPLRAGPRAVLVALMTYAILTLYTGTSDFIYFQF